MAQTALEQIRNYYAFDATLATGGQPLPEQFTTIRDAGFDVIINLALPDSPGAVSEEDKVVSDLGMLYEHIPVPFKCPGPAELDRFFQSLELYRGKKIFIHCAYNWRVSSFVFLYRTIRCRLPLAEALHDLHAIWHPDSVWQTFIDTMLTSYNIEH